MMMIMIEMKKKMIVVKKKLLILRRKKLIIVKKIKKSHTNKSLLRAIDLCYANYQILLITYQESMIRNVKNAWKKKN